MKVKIAVKSWNNYPTPTHTPREGGGGLFMDAKLFNGTTKYQKFLLSPKINLFGLHKIVWCPWQLIRHCNWVI